MFFLVLSYLPLSCSQLFGISIVCYKSLFICDFLIIHPDKEKKKGLFEISKVPSFIVSENGCFENFWKLPCKRTMVVSFLVHFITLAGSYESFPKNDLEDMFCRKLFNACHCKKIIHSKHYLRNFPDLLKPRQAGGCSMQTCNLLKMNFITWFFLNVFRDSQNKFKEFGQKFISSSFL